MKKIYLLILMMLSTTVICHSQDLQTNLDYQYKREEAAYFGYTTYLNSERNQISLSISSNNKLDELQFIKVKFGKRFVNIPFVKLNINIINDDKAINSLVVKLDLKYIIEAKIDCETTIIFQLNNDHKIELPFMFCKLKESLKP